MKNVHILPTDKPSRLLWSFEDGRYYSVGEEMFFKNQNKLQNQNLYITSEEEIKEGDWCIITDIESVLYGQFEKHCGIHHRNDQWKKIILTTDELYIHNDLIPKEYSPFPQYIQKIDDEFLEWICKNPSCEEVFIAVDYEQVNQDNPILKGSTNVVHKYKIILPKEEPKKVLTEEDVFNQRDIDAVTDYINKEQQKQHLIDMMALDEKLGLYEDGSQGYNKQAELVKQLTNKLKCESETSYGAEEVRKIAEWSFHFYKGEDLSDSELEKKWKGLLNERLRKK